jgi:hypothetical protein
MSYRHFDKIVGRLSHSLKNNFPLPLKMDPEIERPFGYYVNKVSKEVHLRAYFYQKELWGFEDSEFSKAFNIDIRRWLRNPEDYRTIEHPLTESSILKIWKIALRSHFEHKDFEKLSVIRDTNIIRERLCNRITFSSILPYINLVDNYVRRNPKGTINLIDGENALNFFDKLVLDGLNIIFCHRLRKRPPFNFILRTEGITSKKDSADNAIIVEATRMSVLYPQISLVIFTRDHFSIDLQRQLTLFGGKVRLVRNF